MATDDDWASYGRAVIDIVPPGRAPFRLVPDQPGTTGGWPEDLVPPVVVVTAWDPDSARLQAGDNQVRHRRLVSELDRSGLVHWPAVGRDPDSPHFEEGVAVVGLTESEGVDLGRRYGQAAVYVWTPEAWTVVSCTDDRRHTYGWRVADRPAPSG